MKQILRCLLTCWLTLITLPALATIEEFEVAVIAHSNADDASLRDMLTATDAANLAFVVAGGIKTIKEPCSDELYEQRKALFDASKNGLIVSAAGSDWIACRYSNGRTAAIDRLNRVRELFFSGDFSLGASKLPLMRQSANPKFRSYSENVRWEVGNVLFATINLPAENNHYLAAAGRNGEFEDRLIANQDWLHRLFSLIARSQASALVLFCDGAPLFTPGGEDKRDGFAEVRKQLHHLAEKFPGKILLVHNAPQTVRNPIPTITWRNNLGDLALTSGWIRLVITPHQTMPFRVIEGNNAAPQ
ncbi:MAG: hypothetical protein JSS58_00230 [Proteobacteria bacterium]|nr:hypothetical protein [Pseudomonadota bacterium]